MILLKSIEKYLSRVEEVAVVVFLSSMVTIAFVQVVLRNVFNTGFTWADEFLRHLVLWTGFISASLATREGRHISIDLMSRLLPPRLKRVNEFIISLGATIFCLILLKASWHFVGVEKSYAEPSSSLKVQVWILELIFPITFSLLSFRFALKTLETLVSEGDKK